MTDKNPREDAINRRAFLLKSGAAGVGLGVALDASTRAAALGMPACQSQCGTAVGPVPATAIADLRSELGNAKVLAPGDSDYAMKGLPMNGRYRRIRPGAIALCQNETDVAICVKWCNKHHIFPVVRGGGHSYAGFSTATGLLIDMRLLNSVDANNGTAVVGGAALNGNLWDATNGGKYFLPVGTCLGVGVGGLVLGGGIGYNTRWAGLTSDSLDSTRIVVASGDVLEASADKNKDLFWACRGAAGGSFGVNTSFTFKLKERPETVTYFLLRGRGADFAMQVFAEFNKLMATGESRINGVARAQAVKTGDGPREAIDVMSRGHFIGSPRELGRLLRLSYPLLSDKWIMTEMPFWKAVEQFNGAASTESHSFGDISRYAKQPISDGAIKKQVDLLVHCPHRSDVGTDGPNGSLWSLGWVGGDVVNSIGRKDTAYVHRGMSTLLRPTCAWPDEDAPEDARGSVGGDLLAWTKDMIAVIAPETPNESYQNFPNRLIEDWKQQYYAENLERLIEIKTHYDKGNLFNNAQSIPPKPV